MNDIIVAFFSGGGLFLFVKFLIERHDKKKSIEGRLEKLEKDGLRLQLLFMIKEMPEEEREILKVAEYYFHTLKGNWYATSVFNKWLEETGVAKPEWFND